MTKFKYIFIFVCLLFVFNINVDAAKLYNYGDCIYNFTGISNDVNGALSIKIHQEKDGNVTYYYSFDKLTTVDDANWKKEGKDGLFNGDNLHMDNWDNNDTFDKCPSYAHFANSDKYHIYFSNNSTESGYEASTTNSYSGMNVSTSTTGEGASCNQTNVDWLSPVPSIAIMAEKDHYCLYYGENDSGCYVLQLNYSKADGFSSKANFSSWDSTKGITILPFDPKKVTDRLKISCPANVGIKYNVEDVLGAGFMKEYIYSFGSGDFVNLSLSKSASALLDDAKIIDDQTIVKIEKCGDLINDELVKLLKSIVGIVRIIVPIILIALGIVDFGTAVFAGDEDKMKKSQSKFIRRLIIGAVIFIIPNVLKLILTIAHSVWPVVDATLCGII